jgi:2-methylcitrate dehydratase PrpD
MNCTRFDAGALLPKVRCEHDPQIEAEFPTNMSGKLTVHARGQRLVRKVIVPKGEPGNFLSSEELMAKFTELARPVIGAAPTERLATATLTLDLVQDVAALFDLGVRAA